MEKTTVAPRVRSKGWVLFSTLISGHAVKHWYQQGFAVILPELKLDMGLSDVQVGFLISTRQATSGIANLASGFLSDRYQSRRNLILSMSMVSIGIAYLLMGLAPTYLLVIPAIALAGLGPAIWHPPAIASLSQRFPKRRGLAISAHGVGGSVGDTIAPIVVGAILVILTWRQVLQIHFFPAIIMAFAVWWMLRGAYTQEGSASTLRSYFAAVKDLVRNRSLLILIVLSGLRGMGQVALITFLPIYLREELEFSTVSVGIHVSLLTFMGMWSQPVLGFLSDRLGRKVVLIPGLISLGLLILSLSVAAPGLQLTLAIAVLGIFFYSLQAIIMASAMDITGRGVEATTVGVMFGGSFVFQIASPTIAGLLIATYSMSVGFYYMAAVVFGAALLMAFVRLPRSEGRV